MATPRSPLGRGLASLIPDTSFGDESQRPEVRLVPREQIQPNPEQPREVFHRAELDALADVGFRAACVWSREPMAVVVATKGR